MNKKLLIAMLAVGASALYVRFQVVGMENGDEIEKARQRAKRERAAAVLGKAAEARRATDAGWVTSGGTEGFVGSKSKLNLPADQQAAVSYNMGNLPAEVQEKVLSYTPFPPHVMKLLYEKLCIPRELWVLQHGLAIHSVAFSPDGTKLATGSYDKTAGIWDVESKKRLKTLQCGEPVLSVAFSPDGKLLATGSSDNTAGIWDVESGKQMHLLRHRDAVLSVVFSPDSTKLAIGSFDGTVGIWDIARKIRTQIIFRNNCVRSIAFSSDGRKLAVSSDNSPVGIWNVKNGLQLNTLQNNPDVVSVAFSADGMKLATGSRGGIVVIWDSSGRRRLNTLHNDEWVSSVAFSPDSAKLAIGSKPASIWDIASGQKLQILGNGVVSSLAFSADGMKLATGYNNGKAIIWDMSCLKEVDRLIRDLKTNYAWFELMRIFDLHLTDRSRVILNPKQVEIFETLPEEVKGVLRPLIGTI